VGFEKIAFAGGALKLTPRAAVGMPVGAQLAKAQPASIRAARMGTKMHGGVKHTGASVGRWHRIGSYRRGRFGMRRLVFTGDAMGFVRETLAGFGLVGAVALGLDGLSWPLWCRGASLRPAIVQHDA